MLAPQPANRILRFGFPPLDEVTSFPTAAGGLAEPGPLGKWALVPVSVPCPGGKVCCGSCWTWSWRWVAKARAR